MSVIARQRCFHHPHREAAARCLECGRYFCRECVTEHEGRVLCARCLEKRLHPPARRVGLALFRRLGQGLTGVFLLWIFFYYIGRILISIPASFHEGTFWR